MDDRVARLLVRDQMRRNVYGSVAPSDPKLARGQVWCRKCGATQKVDSAECLRTGWPKCCGYTMTIDAPDERSR